MVSKIIVYEHEGFQGKFVEITGTAPNIIDLGFHLKVSSVSVVYGTWTLFKLVNYKGATLTLDPENYDLDIIQTLGKEPASSIMVLNPAPSMKMFELAEYQGRSIKIECDTPSLRERNFDNQLSSIIIAYGTWALFLKDNYEGEYTTLCPGKYSHDDVHVVIGDNTVSSVKCIVPTPGIVMYESSEEGGRQVRLSGDVPSLRKIDFDNKVSSVRVATGIWALFKKDYYRGRSALLGPGKIGNGVVSSVKVFLSPSTRLT